MSQKLTTIYHRIPFLKYFLFLPEKLLFFIKKKLTKKLFLYTQKVNSEEYSV